MVVLILEGWRLVRTIGGDPEFRVSLLKVEVYFLYMVSVGTSVPYT